MDEQLKKVASAAPGMLQEGARVVTKLANDNIELANTNAALEHSLRVHKLAMRMDERNLEPALSITEKVAMLEKISSMEKFAAIEAAVAMQAGGFKLANLRDEDTTGTSPTTQMRPGELGSSAHYDDLEQRLQNIG